MSRLKDLLAHGQSVWLDNIQSRDVACRGNFKKLIDLQAFGG
jgi:hypothetical protein